MVLKYPVLKNPDWLKERLDAGKTYQEIADEVGEEGGDTPHKMTVYYHARQHDLKSARLPGRTNHKPMAIWRGHE